MEFNQKSEDKQELVDELWRQLTQRINSEWSEKYSNYGTGLDNINSPTNFAKALHYDMKNEFKQKNIKVSLVNPFTLHNYFKQGGISVNSKVGTLDLFCKYLGYERWTHFIESHNSSPTASEDTIAPIAVLKNSSVAKEPKKRKKWLFLLFPILFLVLASIFAYSINTISSTRFSEKDKVFFSNLIREATQLEFSLYKAVPNVKDTTLLLQYYVSGGMAEKSILGSIYRSIRNNRKLRVPPSAFEILEFDFVKKSPDKVIIETKENWHILWYDTKTNKDERLYDEINDQVYIFVKEGNLWKIRSNIYEGERKIIEE